MSRDFQYEESRDSRKERLLAIRLPEALYSRIDEFCEAMKLEVPWVRMTRSDAVRWLLTVELQNDGRLPGSTA
ncbi:MAG TPA: hypothetical protein VFF73_04075 [Planctomycetota bacterium]|nr:hypothetical protein [Planctomycetota bacterium]